jgi:hypothetical protein
VYNNIQDESASESESDERKEQSKVNAQPTSQTIQIESEINTGTNRFTYWVCSARKKFFTIRSNLYSWRIVD